MDGHVGVLGAACGSAFDVGGQDKGILLELVVTESDLGGWSVWGFGLDEQVILPRFDDLAEWSDNSD